MIHHQIGVIPADSSGVSLFWAVIGGIGSGAFWLLKQLNDQEEKVDDLDDLVQARIDMGQEQIEEALLSLAAINETCELWKLRKRTRFKYIWSRFCQSFDLVLDFPALSLVS